jgi:capsular polysaccharide biosynthesis protein
VEELRKQVDVQYSDKGSQLFSIIVEDRNQKQAVLIANMVTAIFHQEIYSLFNVTDVHILTSAKIESSPSKPIFWLYVFVGFLIGCIIAITTVLFLQISKSQIMK